MFVYAGLPSMHFREMTPLIQHNITDQNNHCCMKLMDRQVTLVKIISQALLKSFTSFGKQD